MASEAADSTPAITEAELGKDTKARRPTTSGSKATAAPATKKKMRKTDKVEHFQAHAFGTLEEHVASHDYPAHVATCGPCKFWKNRRKWSDEFSCLSPVSQKKETWLGCKSGFAICLICAGDKIWADRTKYGRGTGRLLRKDNIKRHAGKATHESAAKGLAPALTSGSHAGSASGCFNLDG